MTRDNVILFVISTFMTSDRNQSPPSYLAPIPKKVLVHTQLIYMYTQQLAELLGAHESLKIKSGDSFRRHTILFPSFSVYVLGKDAFI
jgi:hypothetical protein